MKQRKAMIAVWTALLTAIGISLTVSMKDMDRASISPAAGAKMEVQARGNGTMIRPWPEAAEVRLFVEDLSYEEQERVGATMSNPKGVVLTAAQRATLDKSVTLYRMTAKEYENNWLAACFIPHHFFRYYDNNGRQLGELSVCYCCRGISVAPALRKIRDDEEWQFDYDAVGKMLEEMDIPTDVHCDRTDI